MADWMLDTSGPGNQIIQPQSYQRPINSTDRHLPQHPSQFAFSRQPTAGPSRIPDELAAPPYGYTDTSPQYRSILFSLGSAKQAVPHGRCETKNADDPRLDECRPVSIPAAEGCLSMTAGESQISRGEEPQYPNSSLEPSQQGQQLERSRSVEDQSSFQSSMLEQQAQRNAAESHQIQQFVWDSHSDMFLPVTSDGRKIKAESPGVGDGS
ncbi:hypothetical protein BCR39DRAFT_508064 [Naematelia encephala]|uniref:Uncharacterized protein n=1 Tax=Naematelia encephala TaxID=71784 RepID=A0A1Y2AJG4_9TREE|nr:hypothetical protein BCR39DRAFT_508064 [Naematelia encephala]